MHTNPLDTFNNFERGPLSEMEHRDIITCFRFGQSLALGDDQRKLPELWKVESSGHRGGVPRPLVLSTQLENWVKIEMLKTEEAIKMEPGSCAEYRCKYKPWVDG